MKSFWVKSRIIIVASIIFLPLSQTGCAKASSSYDMPPTVDPSARYLFFLHGMIVEKNGGPVWRTPTARRLRLLWNSEGLCRPGFHGYQRDPTHGNQSLQICGEGGPAG